MANRVAITGFGAVTPVGNDAETTWKSLVAGRFAGKEAVLKAFGTGLRQRMRWTDVEIVSGSAGRPEVHLHGEVAEQARRRGLVELDLSISHAEGLAVAQAVAVWAAER